MQVKVKDRNKDTELFQTALRMSGVAIDYTTAELVLKVYNAFKKKGGKFALDDSTNIRHRHDLKWEKYFEDLRKEHKGE